MKEQKLKELAKQAFKNYTEKGDYLTTRKALRDLCEAILGENLNEMDNNRLQR